MASSVDLQTVRTTSRWWKCRMAGNIIGGILIHITLGTLYAYGNFAPYLVSYMRYKGGEPDLHYGKAVWIYSACPITQGVFMFFGGLLERRIGPKPTILLGAFFHSGGMALSYFTIQKGFLPLLFTYGCMFGIGMSLNYAPPLGTAMRWCPSRKGLFTGIVIAGFGGGAFIFNQVITNFINPSNLSPNVTIGNEQFFSQPELLDRVPTCFLVLGGTYFCMQILGVLLVCYPPTEVAFQDGEINNEKTVKTISNSVADVKETEFSTSQECDESEDIQSDSKKPAESKQPINKGPLQMVKMIQFYNLWFLLFFNYMCVTIVSTLYKVYGQTFIKDDYFLSLVGSFSSVFNAAGGILWGIYADRTSFQVAQLLITCSLSCLLSLLLLSEIGGKAVFFIFICLLFFSMSGVFSTFPSAVMKTFGPKYYAANYGIVFTSTVCATMVISTITQPLLDNIGYHGLFFVGSGLAAVGCFLSFLFKEPTS